MAEVILYEDETLESALKRFKKQVEREEVLTTWRDNQYFEKPSLTRHKKNKEMKRKFKNVSTEKKRKY